MHNNKGFTLLELLIAATIVGALAMYATISYRTSVFETRLAEAKVRTETVANAVQRFEMDYPGASLNGTLLNTKKQPCPTNPKNANDAQDLVNCGYLEEGNWNTEYFYIVPCGKNAQDSVCDDLMSDALACLQTDALNKKIPTQYSGYLYCIGEINGPKERLSAGS
jgi:prepilin-type N-terminal cleavage/methylation domain-containing protein